MSAFSILSDPILLVAFWSGVVAVLLTLLLAIQIMVMRSALSRRRRWEKATISKWMPVMAAAIAGEEPSVVPTLLRRERLHFLRLWIHLQASVRGEAGESLNQMAFDVNVAEVARSYLRRRNRALQLLGILGVGYLRDKSAWPILVGFMYSTDSTKSIQSLWAMMNIDPDTAVVDAVRFGIERDDWALPKVVEILGTQPIACQSLFADMLPTITEEHLPRAFALTEALRIAIPEGILLQLLRREKPEVILGALRLVTTPVLAPAVLACARHADWRVRVQTSRALSRIGTRSDLPLLIVLLEDASWWVRYRAAQAIVGMAFVRLDLPEQIDAITTDRYGREMLQLVIAEHDDLRQLRQAS